MSKSNTTRKSFIKAILHIILSIVMLPAFYHGLDAQIQGRITDKSGSPVSFATIYIENTTQGTVSNEDGYYSLDANNGDMTVVFQFIGYKTERKEIQKQATRYTLNVVMSPTSYEMDELVVRADAEDPAYAIIRQAQAKRRQYRDELTEYKCDVYIKGVQKLLNAPKSILGTEIGDMGGTLDSNRQGIVYLSESLSELYYKNGKFREVMKSSKVSGSDQGYSFNNATSMDFRFYESTLNLNRELVSPIAGNAMSYYRYRLEGVEVTEHGQMINKIKVMPRNDQLPAFSGHIYILEDSWRIHSLDLTATKSAVQIPFLDSVNFRQQYVPIKGGEEWAQLNNIISFRFSGFGFDMKGQFNAVYSDYSIGNISDKTFGSELITVLKEANEKDSMYWEDLRPVPLTAEEERDYIKKDSLMEVRRSDEWRDSVDAKFNEFKPLNLITGYNYRKTRKGISFTFVSPLNIQFNTVLGTQLIPSIEFSKSFDEKKRNVLTTKLEVNYSLTTNEFRPVFSADYLFDRVNFTRISIEGGQQTTQFNRAEPISNTLNSLMTLILRRNYMKLYDETFAHLRVRSYIGNVFYGGIGVRYALRSPLFNNSDYSYFFRNSRSFLSNNPINTADYVDAGIEEDRALTFNSFLIIRPGQKSIRYPNSKFRLSSEYPEITLVYNKAIPAGPAAIQYDYVSMAVEKDFNLKTKGVLSAYVQAGGFITSDSMSFVDYRHFMGNQTHIGKPSEYNRRFFMLDYYTHSTNGTFFQSHVSHNFKGWIEDRIPGFKKLKLNMILSHKALLTDQRDLYQEFAIGFDNIGIKDFRLLRLDFVYHKANDMRDGVGVVLGIGL
jgi:hypothetical protein